MYKLKHIRGKIMVILFLIIIVSFAGIATYYLYANDFNSETLAVIFPAVGAILLSIYLGFKSVRIDAPEPQINHVNIAILHDWDSGNIYSMRFHTASDTLEMSNKFRGLYKIDTYKFYDEFKDMDVWKYLKNKYSDEPHGNESTLRSLLEYAVLDWFSQPEIIPGYQDHGTIYLLQGSGGGGSLPTNVVPVKVSHDKNEWNSFLRAREITLNLPKGSTISRNKPNHTDIGFTINTKHSTIKVRIMGRAGSRFEEAIGPVGQKIRDFLSLPEKTPSLWVHGFQVEIETKQKAFSRFSNQAKVEKTWLERVRTTFKEDFSWDLLRKYYATS